MREREGEVGCKEVPLTDAEAILGISRRVSQWYGVFTDGISSSGSVVLNV
jgi:hypothetical protein